ncbi:ABC transporter permease subunit [Microbacterium sp. SYP-A9085]|nr:ABC transporter permease subunit [Microbacterium sp. SYP-A9085]MRH27778.1 ABC transporter permease subunit [Microbacterium sp. SYP-A9085]
MVLGLAGLLALGALLELLPALGIADARYFPPLSVVLDESTRLVSTLDFWAAMGSTIVGWLTGLLIAIVAGTVLGVLIATVPVLHTLLTSTIEFLRPIPSVALIPLAVLLFGTTGAATLVIVVYASLWPILIQVIYGVQAIDTVATDTARTYRIGTLRILRRVIWPGILSYLFVGIRLSATIALLLEITGELVIGSPGLGKLITVASQSGAFSTMYSLVWIAALLGVLVGLGSRYLENKSMFWHASIRGEVM